MRTEWLLNRKSDVFKWFDEKRKSVEGTGWRRHGGKLRDSVKLHAIMDWQEDDIRKEIQGEERPIRLEIPDGTVGYITQLLSGDMVKARFDCTIIWWDDDGGEHEYDDTHEIEIEIVAPDEADNYYTQYDPVATLVKPAQPPTIKQLELFHKDEQS